MSPEDDEKHRILSAPSALTEVSRFVTGLQVMQPEAAPSWLNEITLPTGWLIGRPVAPALHQPWRVAVSGPQSDGGWDLCETLMVLRYEGNLPVDVLLRCADKTLRALDGEDISTVGSYGPDKTGKFAVTSTGFTSVAGLWVRAQFAYFVEVGPEPGQETWVQQTIFLDSRKSTERQQEVETLTATTFSAFIQSGTT